MKALNNSIRIQLPMHANTTEKVEFPITENVHKLYIIYRGCIQSVDWTGLVDWTTGLTEFHQNMLGCFIIIAVPQITSTTAE